MGYKQYLAVGQSARNRLFGIQNDKSIPFNMLISQQGKINVGRLVVIMFSLGTLALGIILSFVPWLDYIIFRELKLWNGSLSYSYWQKPGVVRLTKVYIFNVTNPQAFLDHGEKPKLVEVGPFVYREDMEKVNIKFNDNDTVTFQHNKILRFVPEMSVDKNLKLVVPNIPLLTVTSFSPNLGAVISNPLVFYLNFMYRTRATPFVVITAEQLVFGYDDPLVQLAHVFYPKGKRPSSQMGLLLARNGTLDEVSTIYIGNDMERFGYINKLNGRDRLPHWKSSPCNAITASEGSFFPPRDITKSDTVYIYDKDICRIMPMKYRKDVYKHHIKAGLYTPPANMLEDAAVNADNKCYCEQEKCPPRGLQNISPCQYNAPVYLSFPHFYEADPNLLKPFEGLQPSKEKHETYFLIQPKLGVPLEGFVRVQLNLKVTQARSILTNKINKFPDIIFPVMWIEEGIHDLTTPIWRWIFLGTVVAPIAVPILTYSMIVIGLLVPIIIFVKAYKNFVFNSDNLVDLGKDTLRRGSTLIMSGSHRLLAVREAQYQPLAASAPTTPNIERGAKVNDFILREENLPLNLIDRSINGSSNSIFDGVSSGSFMRSLFSDETETLITSDNSFILSERRCSLLLSKERDQ